MTHDLLSFFDFFDKSDDFVFPTASAKKIKNFFLGLYVFWEPRNPWNSWILVNKARRAGTRSVVHER